MLLILYFIPSASRYGSVKYLEVEGFVSAGWRLPVPSPRPLGELS